MGKSPNERYHDRIARRYDAIYADDPYHAFCRALTLDHVRPHLPRDARARVLDLGCGTGFFGLRMARSGYRVDFLDLSATMLEQARRKAEEEGLSDVRFLRADAERAEGADREAYALVFAIGDVLSFVGNPRRALRTWASLLVPGGVLVATVDHRPAGFEPYVARRDLDGLERFAADGVTQWLAREQSERFPIRMFTVGELRRLAAAAGLEWVSAAGRPLLPLRRERSWLADPQVRRRLMRIERRLRGEESLLGIATHVEFIARRPGRPQEA